MNRDDLISREETIKCIKKWFYLLGQNPDALVDSIISLPEIDPEQSQGSWRDIGGMYSCSECGSQFYDMSPYCPICGAKMEEFLFFEAVPGSNGVFRKAQGGEYSDE